MTESTNRPPRASLELLRAEAADELSVLIEERLRAGEDPWDFMDDLPTVDELVVLEQNESWDLPGIALALAIWLVAGLVITSVTFRWIRKDS